MPPGRFSRHRFSVGYRDVDGRTLFMGDRTPYGYRDHSDNRHHTVVQGDTLFNLASRYFAGMPRPDGFWWVIADFQPEPIHDPTIALEPGTVVVIPSLQTLQQDIFNERRRRPEVQPT